MPLWMNKLKHSLSPNNAGSNENFLLCGSYKGLGNKLLTDKQK